MSVQFRLLANNALVGPPVDFNTARAVEVLAALGFVPKPGEDIWSVLDGELPAQEFLGRVLVALGLAPTDEGCEGRVLTPAEVAADPVLSQVAGTRTTVEVGGRREGYLQERLGELRELAETALREGFDVGWS